MNHDITRRKFGIGLLGMALGQAVYGEEEKAKKGLQELAGGTPLIGVALPWHFIDDFPDKVKALILKHFDSITPENCMKWQNLCPEEGKFNFERSDRLINYAQQHGMKAVGHTLVFNREGNYPGWLFKDGDRQADAKLVWRRIENHLETVMGRYRGKIDSWDVLNEFVEVEAPGYRHTKYTEVLGPDYPIRLFKLAASHDPNAKLTYNDFGVEQKDRREKILAFITRLQDAGCRVDVVGSQSHLEIGHSIGDEIVRTIDEFSKIGVKCAFTELDVDVVPRRGFWNTKTREETIKSDPYVNGCPGEVLQKQAKVYADVLAAAVENRKWVDRVTFWGLDDGHSWLNYWPWERHNHGLLFDRDFNEKPAFHAVHKALSTI